MTQQGTLSGLHVLVIGMRWDAVGRGVRALAAAGAEVLVYPEGPGAMFGGDEEIITEDDMALLAEPPTPGSRPLTVVEKLGGDQIGDALSARQTAALWDGAFVRLGRIDAVYLSGWYGFTAFDVGREVLERLQAQGGGQLVVTERPHRSDQRLRWYDAWQREIAPDVDVVVLTEPSDEPIREEGASGEGARSASGPAQVLVAEGWNGPFTIADADAWARAQRGEGDALAGQLWRDIGIEHVDSGRIVVGDGSLPLTDEVRAALRDPDPQAPIFRPFDGTFAQLWAGGDWPVGVEVAPATREVTAVRFDLGDEGFDDLVRYHRAGWLDLPSPGLLAVSDPAYLAEGEPRRIEVRPGRWEIEQAVRDDAVVGMRVRHVSPHDPDPFADSRGIDRERATYVIASALDEAGAGPIESCLLDQSGRSAVLRLRSGERYELVIAFDPTPVEGVAEAPEFVEAMVAQLGRASEAQRLLFEADEDQEEPTIDGASRSDDRTVTVTLTDGPAVTVGLRTRTEPVPMQGPEAYRHPADMHGRLSSCAACGATMWPVMRGYPSWEASENQERDQQYLGGCSVGLDEPSAICHTCGWAPRQLWAVFG